MLIVSQMNPRILLLSLAASVYIYTVTAFTDSQDSSALTSLRSIWKNYPPNWEGSDPCGSGWVGIGCRGTRVTSILLVSLNVDGYLSADIASLSELQSLDLSYNRQLRGTIPPLIGNLKKLISLSLVGCGFTGSIPDSIGSLQQLSHLSLNSNGFSGNIPRTIGNLANLYWLDLADNQLEGTIPVSNGTTPGLDLLVKTKHFHFGKNKLSGPVPPQLFSSEMTLLHLLFESNRLNGTLPITLGYVQNLEVVRFDNNSLSGRLPSNINNLTGVHDLYLSNNELSGPLPDISGMSNLNTLDLSNNIFDASDMSSWFSTLSALTTLNVQNTHLRGKVPVDLFSIPHIQTVQLSGNQLNGTLDIGTSYSRELRIVNLRNNSISEFDETEAANRVQIVLFENPVCRETTGTTESYCQLPKENASSLYTTPQNNCMPSPCSSNQIASPKCRCQYPYTGTFLFRAVFYSDYANRAPYASLESYLSDFFSAQRLPVDSVSLSYPRTDSFNYFLLSISIFPFGQDRFNRSAVSSIGFAFSNQTFKPPPDYFGPYVFNGDHYAYFSDNKSSKTSVGIIIGGAVGGSILLLAAALAGVYAYRQKKRAERATKESNPFATWDVKKSSGGVPQLKGARFFSFDEVKKYTHNFSESNNVGSGGYGKVYRGTLATGELVAIKRAQQGSTQGGLEFKTEIELLSRVHHKNVVGLLGFCFERGEQMLIYEFIPNGSLYETLSGKSGIRLDWARRLKIALGAARGLSYLHELANPPIIHRDIKSTNILLDDRLNAKVADFGLSKLIGDTDKGHVTTQVKGTMGYLDPEYYMTQQLTEKSDVYSFGVLMLEIVTGKRPIERGKYIVREVRMALDRTKSLYNLQQMLDPTFGGAPLKGLERFVDLALSCVEESGAERPTMGEVVKEIESIMQVAGLNPHAESATSSSSYEEATKGSANPYGEDSFAYSAAFSAAKIEPQ